MDNNDKIGQYGQNWTKRKKKIQYGQNWTKRKKKSIWTKLNNKDKIGQ